MTTAARPVSKYFFFLPNMLLLPGKAAYFFATGSKYTLMSFIVVHLTGSGLNPQQAGWIVGSRYAMEIVGSVLINYFADKCKRHRFLILVSLCISTLLMFAMPWIVKHLLSSRKDSHEDNNVAYVFTVCLLLNFFAAPFDGSIMPAIDAKNFEISKSVSENLFVKQRIWVSVGLGVVPFITGFVIDTYEGSQYKDTVLFFTVLIINAFVFLSCCFLFKETNEQEIQDFFKFDRKMVHKSSELQKFHNLFKNSDVIMLYLCYLFIGLGFMFQYTFVFLLLKTELQSSNREMGFLVLLQAFSEVLAAPLGIAMSQYFHSVFIPMMIGIFGFAMSFAFYFFIHNMLLMACVNVLVGVSFAVFMFPATNFLFSFSNPNNRGTLFAISSALLNGVGGCIAGFLGGFLFDKYGGRVSFMVMSGLYFVLSFLVGLYAFGRLTYQRDERKLVKMEARV